MGLKYKNLAGIWRRMELALDADGDGDGDDVLPEVLNIVQHTTADHSTHAEARLLENEAAFERGLALAAPDMLDLATGLENDLGTGSLLSNYRIIKSLGSGGMGEAYLAERADGQYQKQVALKILSSGPASPMLLSRFKREIQILAELRHRAIASLLDAGIAEDGRPWFVLDYVPGLPLNEFCSHYQLDQEAVIKLFITVCEAVAHAHRQGIVHRDLKPENILVEGNADRFKPVVLDFGIASREQEDSLTQPGHVMGTPSYASPEQAKGDFEALDHRSDIFSLGILLFELIDLQKPFKGENNADVSYHIIHQDTPALTQAGVSADLSAIIFKCLNKSPADRYASVKALIGDLKNFQSGTSVTANPVGYWFRLQRKVRRYPLTSSLVMITVAVILGLGVTSVWQVINKTRFAAQQAEVAQYFEKASQEIVNRTSQIYSRPLHDLGSSLSMLERRYKALTEELAGVDPSSQSIVRYSLGRAALSLGHAEDARHFLSQAWNAGLNDPVLALRLAQSYMQLHGTAVQDFALLSSKEARRKAFDKARQNYLQPARFFFAMGARANHEETRIAEAMIHYIDGETESALNSLQQVIDDSSWPVPAMLSAGIIFLEYAEQSLLEGNKNAAIEYLQESESLFNSAAQIARSQPSAIKGRCTVRTKLIQNGAYNQVTRVQGNPDVIESCEALITLQPANTDYLIQAGEAYTATGRQMLVHGDDPSFALDKAMDLVMNARRLEPKNPQVLRLLGSVQLTRANWVNESGGDPEALLAAAIESFENAAEFAPGDQVLLQELVQALISVGRMEYANGRDGDPAFEKSNKIQQQLIQSTDAPLSTWIQYANRLSWQGYYRYSSGRDAETVLQQAVRMSDLSLKKAPLEMEAIKSYAMATWTLAEFFYLKGEDPGEMSAQAFDQYSKVIKNDPANRVARINQLGPMSLAVDYALDHQQSQKNQLERMYQLLLELQQHQDDKFEAQLVWVDFWRFKAKQTHIEEGDPANELQTARDYLKSALASKMDRYEAVQSLGYLAVFEHRWRQLAGRTDQQLFELDIIALTKAVEEFPDLPILKALRGQLRVLQADNQESVLAAIEDFTAAIEGNSLLEHRFGVCLTRAKEMTRI